MIHPVILCGGSGTRLWPVSRSSFPKQFTNLHGRGSLFQQSALRASSQGYNAPIIMTSFQYRFIVADQLKQIGVEPTAIVLEPCGRNTAPAAAVASLMVAQSQPDGLLLMAPSDHVIPNDYAFRNAVTSASSAAKSSTFHCNNALSYTNMLQHVHPTPPKKGIRKLVIRT